MRNQSSLTIWRRWSPLILALGIWGVGVGAGQAQTTQQEPPPAKQPQVARCFVKKRFFNLPLNMTQQTRSNISEIHLWCLNNANGKWKLLAKCPPTQTGFDFDSRGEGEFWFTLGMVDLLKRPVPERPELSEYKMVVVVDMTPPMVDAQFISVTRDGSYVIQADVRDAHPDTSKTMVEYQMLNKDWRPLEPVAGGSNRFMIPKEAALTGVVRVTGVDLAENVTAREIELPLLKTAASEARAALVGSGPDSGTIVLPPQVNGVATPPPPPSPYSPSTLPNSVSTLPPPGVAVGSPQAGAPAASTRNEAYRLSAVPVCEDVSNRVGCPAETAQCPKDKGPGSINLSPPSRSELQPPVINNREGGDPIMQRINPTTRVESSTVHTASAVDALPKGNVSTVSSSGPSSSVPAGSPLVPRRLINQRQLKLDYRLEHVGASGVGKVEVWFTADMGQSWQKLGEDSERKSPVVVELPGEGVYGVTIVVSNGRGFGGAPPNPGDAPDTWIEVDLTRPTVEIKDLRCGGTNDPGTVHITWSAHDRNLGPDGVDLYYSTQRDGNWMPIARGLRNEYHYRWTPPASVGSHVFIRVVARDMAGNVTAVETSQPFAVDDMSRPRGRLVSIVPVVGDTPLEPIDH